MIEFINGRWSGVPVVGAPVLVTVVDRNGGKPFQVTYDGRNIWELIDEFEQRPPSPEPETHNADPTPEP